MKTWPTLLLLSTIFIGPTCEAGQAPFASGAPNIPISHADRVYAAEQFSNTVSVIDPASNELLGVIRLGDPQPSNFQSALPRPGVGARHGILT